MPNFHVWMTTDPPAVLHRDQVLELTRESLLPLSGEVLSDYAVLSVALDSGWVELVEIEDD